MGLFTESVQTIAEGAAAIRIICMGFIISSLSVTVSGMLEALGKGAQSLVISLIRYIIGIIPAAYLLGIMLGGPAVWNCFWIAETTASAVAFVLYKRLKILGEKHENKRGSIELRPVFCGDLSGCPIPGSELAVSASKKVKKGVFVDI